MLLSAPEQRFHDAQGRTDHPCGKCRCTEGDYRDTALRCGRSRIPWRGSNVTRYDVWVAEELFLTGTAAEIIPIVKVDGRTIGDGTPGKTTAKFLEAFHSRVSKDGAMLWSVSTGSMQ